MQQQNSICDFNSSDSWVILSPIEQSIKRKIEAVGTPLKDWDIQINYGIKTGFNDAFIISTEKRNEILSNCKTEDERKRTAELIRPFLSHLRVGGIRVQCRHMVTIRIAHKKHLSAYGFCLILTLSSPSMGISHVPCSTSPFRYHPDQGSMWTAIM